MCSVESEQQLEDKLIAKLKTLAFMQVKQLANTADLRAILSQFPDDFMADGREQPTQHQEREAAFTES